MGQETHHAGPSAVLSHRPGLFTTAECRLMRMGPCLEAVDPSQCQPANSRGLPAGGIS